MNSGTVEVRRQLAGASSLLPPYLGMSGLPSHCQALNPYLPQEAGTAGPHHQAQIYLLMTHTFPWAFGTGCRENCFSELSIVQSST